MAALGKAVRSAVSSGRHEITKGMRKTRSIGPNIERWWKVNEVQIPGTTNTLYRAFVDSLTQIYQMHLWHKKFADLLNIVVMVKTNLKTQAVAHVVLFSSDLELPYGQLIDYYRLRFQDRKSTRLNSSHSGESRMPSSA